MKAKKNIAESVPTFGQIVSGISHKLNNPLAAILGYSELLLRKGLDPETRAMLESIRQQTERCKQILQSLNSTWQRVPLSLGSVDIHSLILEALALKDAEFKANAIQVQTVFPQADLKVKGDMQSLRQVFLHLFENARQAFETQAGSHRLVIKTSQTENWIVVQVQDNGLGMKEDTLARIFEPFFTTHKKDAGSGLGLTLCHAILQEQGGKIEAQSAEGQGATLILHLLVGDPAGKPAAPSHPGAPLTDLSGKRILIAEDEVSLAQLLCSLLTPLKARLVQVQDGQAALEAVLAQDFDLIISDIEMPRMNGLQLYHEIASRKPKLASSMVLVTGESINELSEKRMKGIKAHLLYKPFSRAELLGTLSRLLVSQA